MAELLQANIMSAAEAKSAISRKVGPRIHREYTVFAESPVPVTALCGAMLMYTGTGGRELGEGGAGVRDASSIILLRGPGHLKFNSAEVIGFLFSCVCSICKNVGRCCLRV
jgi:hypothetical protein